MFSIKTGGAPPKVPPRPQSPGSPSSSVQVQHRVDRDSFDPAPRRTATTPASFLLASGGGGPGDLRSQKLGELRAVIGDLDSPGAGLALEAMKDQQFPGLELGVVAQKGDRVVYVGPQG